MPSPFLDEQPRFEQLQATTKSQHSPTLNGIQFTKFQLQAA
jgi:hypothetical protein